MTTQAIAQDTPTLRRTISYRVTIQIDNDTWIALTFHVPPTIELLTAALRAEKARVNSKSFRAEIDNLLDLVRIAAPLTIPVERCEETQLVTVAGVRIGEIVVTTLSAWTVA